LNLHLTKNKKKERKKKKGRRKKERKNRKIYIKTTQKLTYK
jgi:hypothetical protein